MSKNAQTERYTTVAITLHWLIALALGGMIALGKTMHTSDGQPIEWMFQLHKSVGITILILMIARLTWRLMNPPPPLPEDMNPLEAKASHGVHMGLYLLCILLPLSGWIMVSASPFSIATVLYGVISWPHLPGLPDLALETRQSLFPKLENVHEFLSWALIALFALHVVGAIKHEISADEGVLKRMIPGLFGQTSPRRAPARGTLAAFGSAALFFGLVAAVPPVVQSLKQGASQPTDTQTQSANWAIDYSASEIRFAGTKDGNDFSGLFEDWTASIFWLPDQIDAGTVSVTIQTGSAVTGDQLYDDTLTAADWFNISAFPAATVALSNFRQAGDGYVGDAVITVKNTTVTTPFVFTISYEDDTAAMTGTATLSRAALNLGQDTDASGAWVSPEITVAVRVQASRLTQ